MRERHRGFIPAAGRDWLLPFYDPLLKLLGADSARRVLVEQASLRPGHRVLDIGCGTGSLAVLLGRLRPDVEVVGLDPDAKALARARRKLERAQLSVRLDQGFSEALPHPDACFDRVYSCFMFHHLEAGARAGMLAEVRRVLRPGGSLHLLDFGGGDPDHEGLLGRTLHSSQYMRENRGGRIASLMSEAGFADARETAHRMTLLGRIAYYAATEAT